MSQRRIYLTGAGVISLTHASAVAKLPNPEGILLSVADPNPAALAEFALKFPGARQFANQSEMLAEPSLPSDIVVVATPPVTHCDLTIAALRTGRHVLCEKPFAMNLDQAQQMLATACAQDRLVGCCSTRFVGVAATEAVKQMLQSDHLGKVYHVTFIQRAQRSRPGVEYQPKSPWFLDRSKSGGGPVLDWGPYDFATLNHVLHPVQVDVLGAWMANPQTYVELPPGAVFDVEEHAGASLLYHLAGGSRVRVTYERAACTHGAERSVVEIEGLKGAVSWDWLSWSGTGNVTRSWDQDGKVGQETLTLTDSSGIKFWDRPLVYFERKTRHVPSPALVNEQSVFNYACLSAIYECARSGKPQSVVAGLSPVT